MDGFDFGHFNFGYVLLVFIGKLIGKLYRVVSFLAELNLCQVSFSGSEWTLKGGLSRYNRKHQLGVIEPLVVINSPLFKSFLQKVVANLKNLSKKENTCRVTLRKLYINFSFKNHFLRPPGVFESLYISEFCPYRQEVESFFRGFTFFYREKNTKSPPFKFRSYLLGV